VRGRCGAAARLGLAFVLASLLLAPVAEAEFGLRPGGEGFRVAVTEEDGSAATQAGSHPLSLTTEVNFNLGPGSPGEPGVPFSDGDVKDLRLELPPGLIENPAAVSQCALAQFHTPRESEFEASLSGESCPGASQIGVVTVRTSFGGGTTRTFGVFNLVPPPGAPSELGFNAYGAPITFVPQVRQAEGEYGLTLEAESISQLVNLNGFSLTIWGAPWSVLHNAQRGDCLNEAEPGFGWAKCSVGRPLRYPPLAYLTLPSACEGPLIFGVSADSWQEPSRVARRSFSGEGLEGCDALAFATVASGQLSNPRASSPSGFDFNLDVDNTGFLTPGRLATSPVRRALVSLPAGMTINPSVGAGLGVCTPAAYAAETVSSPFGDGCPGVSKIGDFSVRSPLFAKVVEGSLFLAAPFDNPFGTLLGVYLVAKDSERGILVKVAGRLDADPASGHLVASFDKLPQLPYTNLRVHFREGQRSPLATPGACGAYATEIELSPWRAPATVRRASSPLTIAAGVGGGPCPTGAAPFVPQAQAGTLNSQAGAYTPFYLHLTRTDVEQEVVSYSTTLPPGLLGKLAGIPFCPDAAIEAAKRRGGFEEAARPSCPAASAIGHTVAGFGLGPVLAYAPGGLYLAGPFHGSAFSVVAIDSATVGPFDLGVVVVRSAIEVDSRTAQVSIDSAGSDPIPHIIDGIPIHLRDVRVHIDRPGFTVNPTSCERASVASRLGGSGLRFSDPADDSTAIAAAPFQAFNCGALRFAPRLGLRLRGGTRRGDYPSLRAEVRPRPGDANIARAAVTLPPSEFLAQNHLDTICTRPQFARDACPGGAVYGHARAFTPLLGEPLEGPVYLRSSDNPLPDLVAALRGGGAGIAIDVVGRIDAVHGGLRGSFDVLPDAPVTRFVMRLNGGKRGILANAEDLCGAPQLAKARLVGKNNLGEKLKTRVQVRCPKHRGGHDAKKGARG
jgi:hypothetical protein